ncbi:MAG: hypothetical protein NTW38_00475 [Candidatus Aminicenantes bacterium]|nr:hypothetical protein [Candidatus Aminicenantes bacterium]
MSLRAKHILIASAVIVLFASVFAAAQTAFDEGLLKNLTYRNLGPFRAGSWVTCFAVPTVPAREHLYTLYVGTRNGGVWKTINAGTTFEPVFDAQPKLSIGDVAVAPTDANIVWVGTGEAANARSSNSGDGVYNSTDAGKTWTNMGLADSHHIARVVIHPKNPDIVYVASMGHLFTTNAERGVFKTTDGGKSWAKVLYIDERIGVVDLAIVEAESDVLYAATYEKVRLPWHYELGGPESGIYKTTDGGKNWTRLGGGLPTGRIGRIGLDVYQKNSNILCAVVENGNRREPTAQEAEMDKRRGGTPPARTAGNEVFRSDDAGITWRKINSGFESALNKSPYAFNQLRLDPNDPDTVYITGQSLASTNDGGKTWKGLDWPSNGVMQKAFGDWRCLWIDPLDSNRLILGSDGGVNISYDRGLTCHHAYNIPLTEFYAVGVDMEDPYNIYGGLQDHDSWKGPSNGWAGEISLADWVTVGGGDGMYNCVDPTDSRWIFNNREMGTMWRFDQKNGIQTLITPRRPADAPRLRFNWTAPIALSPHNPAVVYTGAQVVFRSDYRGDHWKEISPDLTTNEDAKQHGEGFITFCTITTLAESPVTPGVIWTGSDDGKVQVTKDGGAAWLDRTSVLASAGAPANYWVSRVFPSPHDAGTCFVSKTGLRLDEFNPVLYRTTDYGETWTSISGNLPSGKSVNVVVQDRKNPDLLFVGTEQGVYVTIDGGATWVPFKNNMPWVKVTDLVIHPRENDLVVASYGRGAWIADIAPLQEMKKSVLDEDVHLFDIEPRTQRIYTVTGNYQLLGDSHLLSPNEPNEVILHYYLKAKAVGPVKITVSGPDGKIVTELSSSGEAGMNAASWDMRVRKPGQPMSWGWDMGMSGMVEPGEYLVKLEAGGRTLTKKAVIRYRQGWTFGAVPTIIK